MEAEERERVMEEQWKLAMEKIENEKPEFVIPTLLGSNVPLVVEVQEEQEGADDLSMFGITKDDKKGVEISSAYDGDLNPMTFNHVKTSNAFASHRRLGGNLSIIEEEVYDGKSSYGERSDFNQNNKAIKKSEDGW